MNNKKTVIGVILTIFVIVILIVLYSTFSCVSEGQIYNTNIRYESTQKCCDGLSSLSYFDVPDNINKDDCNQYIPEGNLKRVCSNCGNNICDEWENICNCPSDCK